MLCSNCHKNTAVIFLNKIEGNKTSVEGLCYSCAKAKGINPIEMLTKQANISEEDVENMSKQFENMFSDISNDLLNDVNINNETNGNDDTQASLGSFMSNIFGTKDNASNDADNTNRKKIKIEKKPKENKKKRFLDNFGTNLTEKARQNELDIVVGRNSEIQRVIQILNRRSKNNPCLIGEPGVRKNSYCSRFSYKNC